jgi:tripartite-type tricarboxylate transporter receptor subunit TctC
VRAARQVLSDPALDQAFRSEGSMVDTSTPAEFAAEVQSEVAKWKQIGVELNLAN